MKIELMLETQREHSQGKQKAQLCLAGRIASNDRGQGMNNLFDLLGVSKSYRGLALPHVLTHVACETLKTDEAARRTSEDSAKAKKEILV